MQVQKFREKLCLGNDVVKVNVDAVSLRSFMTYVVKRHDGSVRRVSYPVRSVL